METALQTFCQSCFLLILTVLMSIKWEGKRTFLTPSENKQAKDNSTILIILYSSKNCSLGLFIPPFVLVYISEKNVCSWM